MSKRRTSPPLWGSVLLLFFRIDVEDDGMSLSIRSWWRDDRHTSPEWVLEACAMMSHVDLASRPHPDGHVLPDADEAETVRVEP